MPNAESVQRPMRSFGRAVVFGVGVLAGAAAFADDSGVPPLQMDFGGVGLLQTPTARMADTGQLAVNYRLVEPYSTVSLSVQPFDWLEFGFRYTSIRDRSYGISDRDYLDKGVNLKLRLLDEGRYMPAVALGFRDLGGTGLFSSEYLVFNKRWHNFDFSLGLGWGYLASGGGITNPLGYIADRFKTRRGRSGGSNGGEFGIKHFFSGDMGVFAGVQYQTPWQPLALQLEYDANDYENEPAGSPLKQDFPINIGAHLQLTKNLSIAAGWERGNTLMVGATFSLNLAQQEQPKLDPAPVPTQTPPQHTTTQWQPVVHQLAQNAGIHTTRIARQGDGLVVEGQATTYRSLPETELRANRILNNVAGSDINEFKYRWQQAGLYLREDTLPRQPLPDEIYIGDNSTYFTAQDYRNGVHVRSLSPRSAAAQTDTVLYDAPSGLRYEFGLAPGLQINYGGPDGFLYQTLVTANGRLWTDPHGFLSGSLGYVAFGNFDKLHYTAPSGLPRVRTHIGDYLKETDLGVFNLQYTRTARLSENWFAMGYIGYLEMMYGGVGAEVLYRPFNNPLAIGVDMNWVRQREFDGGFGFRDYDTVTGAVTSYWQTGYKDVLAQVSVGRYLAKDWGVTLDLSRQFDSGIRIGAYATITDAGHEAYGEGSFDKGVYIEIPWDLMFTHSSRNTMTLTWDPLTRDGGARLNRRYNLYEITDERALGTYWADFETAP